MENKSCMKYDQNKSILSPCFFFFASASQESRQVQRNKHGLWKGVTVLASAYQHTSQGAL